MNFSIKTAALQNISSSCLILGVYENKSMPVATEIADKACKKAISKLLEAGDISGKTGSSLLLQSLPGLKAKRILLVGCGKKTNFTFKRYASILKSVTALIKKTPFEDVLISLATLPVKETAITDLTSLIAQQFETSAYRYTSTKSKPQPASKLKTVNVYISNRPDSAQARKGLVTGKAIGRGMNFARDLGNLPGNICTPTYLSEQAIALGKKHKNLKTKILTEAQMKRLGMGSLLSVGHGSAEPSAFIIMEYKGTAVNTKPNVIVGKGITFDTGGISLKPGAGMDEMKFDMCGAASVLGSMQALCEIDASTNVIGVIASAENMPSDRATKPGDVVTSMSGQTIEVLNTDAEGRLVLCDALTYVERFDPKSVVDIATLTGACIVALGNEVSGLMSNDDDLAATLYESGQKTLDYCWQLPIWDLYQKQLDSNFADMGNIGGRGAGSITAACFLSRFAKKYKWAHLDIAGTAWLQGAQKGATGRPVPLLLDYLLNN